MHNYLVNKTKHQVLVNQRSPEKSHFHHPVSIFSIKTSPKHPTKHFVSDRNLGNVGYTKITEKVLVT